MSKQYIGDSVYVEDEGCQFKLTTENGFGPTNTIYLDETVIKSLVRFYERSRNLRITITEKENTDE